jgi:aminoglycoside 6'-N-acetyltransferase
MAFPLVTKRLSIEPLRFDDLTAFVAYRRDPEIARFQSWDTSYSEKQANELITSQAGVSLPSPGQWLQLAVHDKATGELIGDLALHAIEERDSQFEIGFTIAKQNQRKGYAFEAASKLIDYLFSQVEAKSVIAQTDRRNLGSIKLLTALGFQHDPTKSWTEIFKGEEVEVDHFFITA